MGKSRQPCMKGMGFGVVWLLFYDLQISREILTPDKYLDGNWSQ